MASNTSMQTSVQLPAPLGAYAHLLPPSWKSVITSWLAEDTPSFDYGGFVVGEGEEEATLWGKSEVRICCIEGGDGGELTTWVLLIRVYWRVALSSMRSLLSWAARTYNLET
jgi:hypothetical protein